VWSVEPHARSSAHGHRNCCGRGLRKVCSRRPMRSSNSKALTWTLWSAPASPCRFRRRLAVAPVAGMDVVSGVGFKRNTSRNNHERLKLPALNLHLRWMNVIQVMLTTRPETIPWSPGRYLVSASRLLFEMRLVPRCTVAPKLFVFSIIENGVELLSVWKPICHIGEQRGGKTSAENLNE
jgi:hypothetical protein